MIEGYNNDYICTAYVKDKYLISEFKDVAYKKEANEAEQKYTKHSGSHTVLKRISGNMLLSKTLQQLPNRQYKI